MTAAIFITVEGKDQQKFDECPARFVEWATKRAVEVAIEVTD